MKATFKIEEVCKFKIMNLKIEQRDAVAPLLDEGTDVIAVLLLVFNGEFYFPPLFHWKWKLKS